MRRIPFVIVAMSTLWGAGLLAEPTPTPTPPPHDGPTLEITFSGMTLFIKTPQGYKVVLPAMRAHNHEAYLRFPVKKVNAVTFDASDEFPCEGAMYRWAPLTADQLTIQPASAIVDTPLDDTGIANSLVHLKELAQGSDLNHAAYDQASPILTKVAAQMTVSLGTLKRLELDGIWSSHRWEFKDGDQTSGVQVCGTSGIRWLIPLVKGTKKVSLVSTLPGNPKLSLNVSDGDTTEVIVGNSLLTDVGCPDPTKQPEPTDPHFKLFYKILKAPVAREFIPVRSQVECGGTSTGEKRTRQGSDCLGGQWP